MGISNKVMIIAIAILSMLMITILTVSVYGVSINAVSRAILSDSIEIQYIIPNRTNYIAVVYDYYDETVKMWILDQSLNVVSTYVLPYTIDDWVVCNVWNDYIIVYSDLKMSIDVYNRSFNIVTSFNISQILGGSYSLLYLDVLNGVIILMANSSTQYVGVFMDILNPLNVSVKNLYVSLPSNTFYKPYGFYANNRIIYPAYIANLTMFYPAIVSVSVSRINTTSVVSISRVILDTSFNINIYDPSTMDIVYDGYRYYYLLIKYRGKYQAVIAKYDSNFDLVFISTPVNIRWFVGMFYLYNHIYIVSYTSDAFVDIYDVNINLLDHISILNLLADQLPPMMSNISKYSIDILSGAYDAINKKIVLCGDIMNVTTTGNIINVNFIGSYITVLSESVEAIIPILPTSPTNTTTTTEVVAPTGFDWTMLLLILMILILIAGVAVATKR